MARLDSTKYSGHYKDRTGQRYGKLVAIHPDEKTKKGLLWLFRCDCGQERVMLPDYAKFTCHCGCLTSQHKQKIVDRKGERYGKLVAVQFVRFASGGPRSHNKAWWLFQCDCGKTREMPANRAKTRGHCGCLDTKRSYPRMKPYQYSGGHGTAEFRTWHAMRGRCLNERHTAYKSYGGRGIQICQAWRDSFLNFLADMGPKPGLEYTIDRKDHNGHYACGHCPECITKGWMANCQWANKADQSNNRRCNRRFTIDGVTKTMTQWARMHGKTPSSIDYRLSIGWSLQAALETPLDRNHRAENGKFTKKDVLTMLDGCAKPTN